MSKQKLPFGLWPTSLTPEMVARGKRLTDVQWHQGTDSLVWEEGRSGLTVLVSRSEDGAFRELLDSHQPKGSVGYGGGAFCADRGEIIFANKDQRLYRMSGRYGLPQAITPALGGIASPTLSPDHQWVLYVSSDGNDDALAAVPLDGSRWPMQLVQGSDFYMQPCWHPQGSAIAWVEWNHPQMPWEGTRLMLGHLNRENGLEVRETVHIDGDEKHPAREPQFSPDGRYLSYLIQKEDWDTLMLFDLESCEQTPVVAGDGFMLSEPAWVQGQRSYGWSPDSNTLTFFKVAGSFMTVWQVDVQSGQQIQLPTQPYTAFSQLSVSQNSGDLALIASACNYPARILRWDGQSWHTVTYATPDLLDPDLLPTCEEIRWKAEDGTMVYGLYYAPRSSGYKSDGVPPAFINVHGGPSSCAMAAYSPFASYFAMRGYAWLEVNHRGSTGFGRTYMDFLRGQWGKIDVEDAVDGGRALVNQHLADASRLVIRGGSAGGYTVLNALTNYPGTFAAGISLYGISNLFALAMDTHKFEAHYQDSLIGKLPKASSKYRSRSALFHADQIRDPLMIFQGDEDTVVPPNQSEQIVAEIRKQGIPYLYQVYQGEGHGFRKAEHLVDSIEQTERFLQQYVLFREG